MTSRVLLTGASGLIGSRCAPALQAAGFDVVVASHSGKAALPGVETLQADLLDRQQVSDLVRRARASHLLHLAWHNGAKDRWVSERNLDWVAATFHLVREFASAGGKRAVGVGSCAEYDWSGDGVYTETSNIAPATLYGAAKAAAGLALTRAEPALGLSLAWARVFFCYGPGEPRGRLMGDLIHGLAAGERVSCTDGLQVRDFMHTDDVAAALAVLVRSGIGGAVNIGTGAPVAVKTLIGEVAHQIGRPDLVEFGAIPRPATDPPLIQADIGRLTNEVEFRPRISLTDGVKATLAEDLGS